MKIKLTTIGRGVRGGALARLGVWGVLLGAALLWSCSNSNDGAFNFPVGIAVDSAGKIYVADEGNNRIVRMDDITGMNLIALSANPANTADQLRGPLGVAVDGNNPPKIYVADTGNNRIVRFDDMNGANWTSFTGPTSPADSFFSPAGIAVKADDSEIYVADEGHNRIVQMDDLSGNSSSWHPYGIVGTETGSFQAPNGIAVDSGGKIYVADYGNNRIVQLDDLTGNPGTWHELGSPGSGINQFNGPAGIAVKADGSKIDVSDGLNNRIIQMDNINGDHWTSYP